jgi:hypothetical protein
MRRNQENASARGCRNMRRAGSALITLTLAATPGVTAAGCSGEDAFEEALSRSAESNEAAENALIAAQLGARGYDTSSLQFGGDTVVVEGEMVMSRTALLDDAEAEATGVIDKGYFHTAGLFSGKRIALSFAGGVSTAWQTAERRSRRVEQPRSQVRAGPRQRGDHQRRGSGPDESVRHTQHQRDGERDDSAGPHHQAQLELRRAVWQLDGDRPRQHQDVRRVARDGPRVLLADFEQYLKRERNQRRAPSLNAPAPREPT